MGREFVATFELNDRLGHLPVFVQFRGSVEVPLRLGPSIGRGIGASRAGPRRDRERRQSKNDPLQQSCHFTSVFLHSP